MGDRLPGGPAARLPCPGLPDPRPRARVLRHVRRGTSGPSETYSARPVPDLRQHLAARHDRATATGATALVSLRRRPRAPTARAGRGRRGHRAVLRRARHPSAGRAARDAGPRRALAPPRRTCASCCSATPSRRTTFPYEFLGRCQSRDARSALLRGNRRHLPFAHQLFPDSAGDDGLWSAVRRPRRAGPRGGLRARRPGGAGRPNPLAIADARAAACDEEPWARRSASGLAFVDGRDMGHAAAPGRGGLRMALASGRSGNVSRIQLGGSRSRRSRPSATGTADQSPAPMSNQNVHAPTQPGREHGGPLDDVGRAWRARGGGRVPQEDHRSRRCRCSRRRDGGRPGATRRRFAEERARRDRLVAHADRDPLPPGADSSDGDGRPDRRSGHPAAAQPRPVCLADFVAHLETGRDRVPRTCPSEDSTRVNGSRTCAADWHTVEIGPEVGRRDRGHDADA